MARNEALNTARLAVSNGDGKAPGITWLEVAKRAGVDYTTVFRARDGVPISDLSESKIAYAVGVDDRRKLFPESVTA